MSMHASDIDKNGVITASQKKTRRKALLTLAQIAARQQAKEEAQQQKPVTPNKMPRKGRLKRVFFRALLTPLFLLIFVASLVAVITSPAAEPTITRLITDAINSAGKPMGLRVYIGSIGGLWQGEVRLLNLRVHDAYGPWLHVDEATLHPLWESFIYGARAIVQAQRGEAVTTREQTAPVDHNLSANIEQYQRDTDSILTSTTPDQNDNTSPANTTNATAPAEKTDVALPDDIMDNLLKPGSVLRDKVVIALRDGTIIGVRMPRFPRYASPAEPAPETPKNALTPFAFLPSWLALDIGELEISDFLLGPVGRNVYISGRLHGQLNCESARLRSTLMLEKDKPKQWVLPATQDLPGDITLTVKELRSKGGMPSAENSQNLRELGVNKLIAFLSLDAHKENFDMRWRVRDELVTPFYLAGVDRIWSRMRVLGRVPVWPPTKEHPAHIALASRFGVTFAKASFAEEKPRRIRASVASAQMLWDGERLVVRDVNLISPIKEPFLSVSASFGAGKEEGLGAILQMSVKDVTPLAQALDPKIEDDNISGAANMTFTAIRGGEHLMWWTKPLPPVQEGRSLPGFIQSPKDFSVLGTQLGLVTRVLYKTLATIGARHNIVMVRDETRLPPPSAQPTAMGVQLKIESPLLHVPRGTIKDLYISIRGASVEAKAAIGGTGYQKTEEGKILVSDFSTLGIPQGLVGSTRVRVGNLFNMGIGSLEGRWFLGGLHEKAAVFLADLEDFTLTLPGIHSDMDMGFAYALPVVKRRWPWMDGTMNISVEHWRLLAALLNSPVRGNDVSMTASWKSFLDTNGKPQQFFTSNIQAQRLDSTAFMVQDVQGTVESKYVHALADVIALTAGPLWQAKLKKVEYSVPDGAELLTSSLKLAEGRSGSFRWNWGSYAGSVQGEDAKFLIQMNGDIDASLNGAFNFRRRVLSLGKMHLKTLKN